MDIHKNEISEITRQNIFDEISLSNIPWWGRLPEVDFLSRIFDLEKLPSTDHRYNTALDDIYQHRIRNDDWKNDWIFYDDRLNLRYCSDEELFKFLCEMMHPVVVRNADEIRYWVDIFNNHLIADGWELKETQKISGKPIYSAIRCLSASDHFRASSSVIDTMSSEYVSRQIDRMQKSIDLDPEVAIGTAKEFIETICKEILIREGAEISKSVTLLELIKSTQKSLQLVPEGIPEYAKGKDNINKILRSLGTLTQELAELRGKYGSGHGKNTGFKGMQPRHARLAVGAASTLGLFLWETYSNRSYLQKTEN